MDYFSDCIMCILWKNHLVPDFLVWSGGSCTLSFGFRRAFSNREMMDVMAFLSLLKSHSFRLGRRDVRVWSPNPLDRFSYKSFF